MPDLSRDPAFLQRVIDSFPALTFVVTSDVYVVAFNSAASRSLDLDGRSLGQLAGNVLTCVNAWEGDGCGRTRKCRDCDVRLSVARAQQGDRVDRKRSVMRLRGEKGYGDFYLLISASPFDFEGQRQVLLVVENVTELVGLRRLLPICAQCGQVRNDSEYLEQVHAYLDQAPAPEFPVGICTECSAEPK